MIIDSFEIAINKNSFPTEDEERLFGSEDLATKFIGAYNSRDSLKFQFMRSTATKF